MINGQNLVNVVLHNDSYPYNEIPLNPQLLYSNKNYETVDGCRSCQLERRRRFRRCAAKYCLWEMTVVDFQNLLLIGTNMALYYLHNYNIRDDCCSILLFSHRCGVGDA